MTTQPTPFRKEHTMTGSIVPLPYDWKIDNESHLLVTLVNPTTTPATETQLVVRDDYTVSGVGASNGGNVTPATAYTAGWKIVITSSMPYEQNTDFTNQNSVKPETIEDMADNLSRQIKQIVEIIARCVKTTVGGVSPDELLNSIYTAAKTTAANVASCLGYTNQAQAARDAAQLSATAAATAAALLPKNNYSAVTNPNAGDDSADGYSTGSQWVNTLTSDRFLCSNAAVGAAVWQDVSGIEPTDLGNMAFEDKTSYFAKTEVATIRQIPQNLINESYALVLSDAGKHLYHTAVSAHVYTIPKNADVAFPIGTAITFVAGNGSTAVSIAIDTDTMRLAGAGTTGTRTLAANGMATALKVDNTEWIISGTGLT